MAHWLFSEEHDILRKSIRTWIEREIRDKVEHWEETKQCPRELFEQAGELGFLGVIFSEEYGGFEDYLSGAVFLEELALCGSRGIPVSIAASILAGLPIYNFGSEDLKQRYLVPTVDGEKIGALAVTEPEAGSDATGIQTTAKRDGNHYVVNGRKAFVTNGILGDYIVAAVKTDPSAGREQGISLLVIERDTPGLSVARKLDKMGWLTSDTADLVFEECRVPVANLVGEENEGLVILQGNFAWEAIGNALLSVSNAQLALDEGVNYSQQRVQFKRKLCEHQVIRHYLADIASIVEAARCLAYYALAKFATGEDAETEAAMAKVYASEVANQVADMALQIHGGYGYMQEYPISRYWRDARLGNIAGGTNEIMRQAIVDRIIF